MSDVRDACGLDLSTVNPPDALAALRSYPRRYRAALATPEGDDDDPEAVARRRPAPEEWSALEHTTHVADAFRLLDEAIRRAVVAEGSIVAPWWEGPPPVPASVRAALDALTEAADHLADTVGSVPSDAWGRTALVDGTGRDVLWLAREGVHQGAHHLRDVERVLRAARGRGPGPAGGGG